MGKNIYKMKFESLVMENIAREGEHQREKQRLREKAVALEAKIDAVLAILEKREGE